MIETRPILLCTARFALALALSLSISIPATPAGEPAVKAAQERLAEVGFDPGPADGLLGPLTRKAIKEFQKANNLPSYGRLDAKTLKALFPGKTARAALKPGDKILRYEKLGWKPPQSGATTLSRFRRKTGSLEMKRSVRELIVADGDGVYLIASGDSVPGFDCDPANGRIEMELMLGPGGPVVFRPLDRKGYCQLGFGILLQVGQRLRLTAAEWNGVAIAAGLVEVGTEGLVYVEPEQ